MSWRRELKPVNFLLLAGIAFLLVAIIQIWWGEGGAPSPPPSAKGPEVPTAPVLRDQRPLSAFSTVVAKNLFNQDRSDPGAGIAKVQDTLEGRELLGTMIIGDTKVAIIGGKLTVNVKSPPEAEAVYLGEEWHGFKLLEISNDSVTFAGKDGQRTLKFPE